MTITLTYDETLSRVVITGTDLPDGFVRIERSINGLLWETVRGGSNIHIDGGGFELYDYEFIACIENMYRAAPGIVENLTTPTDDQINGTDWTVPFGVTSLTFEAWGGGGRGQGNQPPAEANSPRPGGGGGSYARSEVTVSGGETLTIRVGEGGHQGGQTSDHDGASSYVKRGTTTLLEAVGGSGASGFDTPGTGGDGALNVGQVRQSGGDGGARESEVGAGGGGGGSAFPASSGGNGQPGLAGIGGAGGDGYADGGAGGNQEPGLRLPGAIGQLTSTPNDPSLVITGDIDLRAMVATTDFTPGSIAALVAKWDSATNNRSYVFRINTNGTLGMVWSTNGTDVITAASTVPIDMPSGALAARATLDVNNDDGGRTVTFYTAPTSPTALEFGPWTQVGAPVVVAGVTSIFNSNAILEIGSIQTATTQVFNGNVYSAQVRNGIGGTVVANPAFYAQPTDTTSFVDSTGKTWTVTAPGRIINETTAGGNGTGPGGGGGGQGNNQAFTPGTPLSGDGATGQLNVYSWYGYPFAAQGLSLPGEAGDYASTPDAAPLDITGDLDLRADLSPETWNNGAVQAFIAKWVAPGQQSYVFELNATGGLSFLWSTDGTAVSSAASTVNPVPDNQGRLSVRAVLDVDSGVGQHRVTFYTGPSLSGPWTQLGGAFMGGGVTSVFASSSPLEVGSTNNGTTDLYSGVVHGVQVLNGIDGTAAANPDFDAQAPGTTTFTDAAGREWTLNGGAEIQGSATFEGTITPMIDRVWLKSIKYPFLNRPVDCPNYGDKTRTFRGGIFDVQGRSLPIAVNDLKRSKAWTMTILTHTMEEARDMELILAANQVMFIHVPCEDPNDCGKIAAVPGGYVVTLDTVEHRTIAGSHTREWILPLREVVKPAPDIVGATMIWRAVLNYYGSWEALIASNPTWIDLLRDVATPEDLVVL